jgi:hypothetical protein
MAALRQRGKSFGRARPATGFTLDLRQLAIADAAAGRQPLTSEGDSNGQERRRHRRPVRRRASKIVDWLTESAQGVVRFHGGATPGYARHRRRKTVLRLIPSGVLHEGVPILIGNGVVLSPSALLQESASSRPPA